MSELDISQARAIDDAAFVVYLWEHDGIL